MGFDHALLESIDDYGHCQIIDEESFITFGLGQYLLSQDESFNTTLDLLGNLIIYHVPSGPNFINSFKTVA
jgi:hypothetical protein